MISFFALVASIVTIVWARKIDIAAGLNDEASRKQIIGDLDAPPRTYRKYLNRGVRLVDRLLQRGAFTYFALLFVALIYSSFLFLLYWTHGQKVSTFMVSSTNEMPEPWIRKLIFIGILVLFFACFLLAKRGASVYEERISRLPASLIWYAVLSALATSVVAFSIYFLAGNRYFSFVVILFSVGPILLSNVRRSEEYLLSRSRIKLAFNASFGPTALFIVIFSLIAGKATQTPVFATIAIVALVSLLSGATAYAGARKSSGSFLETPVWSRPAISMGLYIANNFPGFCLAVSLAAFFPILLGKVGADDVSVVAAVLLTSAIFLAGAKTLAGSGFVIFFVLSAVSITLYNASITDFFSTWSGPLIFWVVFPFVNSIFDFATWTSSRLFAARILKNEHSNAVFWLFLDIVVAFLLICLLAMSLTYIFRLYEIRSIVENGSAVINTKELVSSIEADPFGFGGWFIFMMLSTFVPTIGHLVFAVMGGVSSFVPVAVRRKIRRDIMREAKKEGGISRYNVELFSWRLAYVDHITGIVVFVALMLGFVFLAYGNIYELLRMLHKLVELVLVYV